MYVERLKIENFRNIRETEFELNYPGKENGASALPNVNLFLGDNGSGKSSVFKALALAILGKDIAYSGFLADYLVRRVKGKEDDELPFARLIVDFQEDWQTRDAPPMPDFLFSAITYIIAGDEIDVIRQEQEPVLAHENLILGYGANRRTAPPDGYNEASRSLTYRRIASLFEDRFGLIPVEYGWYRLAELWESHRVNRFNEARLLVNDLLPPPIQLASRYDTSVPRMFECDGIAIPFSGLSDGFRVFVGWVWDMLVQLAMNAKPDELLIDQRGIVIVDEIDLLLHPEWQRVVIPKVAKAFPNIQFCFSTHSPLVAGTVEKENLYVMETEPDGSAVVRQYREDIHGLTPNQILTSSYFGLASVRAPNSEPLVKMLAHTANGNGSTDSLLPTPDPAFNQWLDEILEKESASEIKPKRTRRKKTLQD